MEKLDNYTNDDKNAGHPTLLGYVRNLVLPFPAFRDSNLLPDAGCCMSD